jgi:hypothetical protein
MKKQASIAGHCLQFNIILLVLFAAIACSSCSSASQSSTATPTINQTSTSTLATPPSPTSPPTPSPSPTSTPTFQPTRSSSPTLTATSSPGSASDTVTRYYQALEKHNYSLAYSFLDANATLTTGQKLTQEVFTSMAQTSDASEGSITVFSVAAYPPLIVMTVTRRYGPYHAHLQVKLEGTSWKITSIDRI